MTWITRHPRRMGRVKGITPKVPKTVKRKRKQGRAKKRKQYNDRFKNPSPNKEVLKYFAFPRNLPVESISTYTHLDDGIAYRYIEDPGWNWWYYDRYGIYPHHQLKKGANSYAIQKERNELIRDRMLQDFVSVDELPNWGHEHPRVTKPSHGAWSYRKTIKRLNYLPSGIIDPNSFLNLSQNIPGVSKRRNSHLTLLNTAISWKDSVQSVNKPVQN